jgi:hypothetical protein
MNIITLYLDCGHLTWAKLAGLANNELPRFWRCSSCQNPGMRRLIATAHTDTQPMPDEGTAA